MGGNSEPTSYVCRLCGGKIEGHRVYMGQRVRYRIIRTTCAAQGARLDAAAPEEARTREARMGAECAERREVARTALQRPIRSWGL